MTWTPQRTETLKRMWADGASCADIGRVVGKSRNAISGKIHRLGLSGRFTPSFPVKDKTRVSRRTEQPHSAKKGKKAARVAKTPKPAPVDATEAIAFDDLQENQCRYFIGDGHTHCCGKPTKDGSSYCEHHHAVVWTPADTRPREPREYVNTKPDT